MVVRRVEPTEMETEMNTKTRGGLMQDMKNDPDKSDPREWVVIEWLLKRRRVPLRAFEVVSNVSALPARRSNG